MGYAAFLRANLGLLTYGFALTFFSSFGQTYFVSMFGDAIKGDFALDDEEWGRYYSLATVASGLLLIWIGRTIDHVDLRWFSLAAGLGVATSCCVMGLIHAAWLLPLGFFAVRFTGQGLMSHAAFTSMARYFEHARGKATTIAALGFPVGSAVFPLFAVLLLSHFEWRDAWLLCGLALFVVLPVVVLTLLRGHKARHEALLDSIARPSEDADRPVARQWTRAQVLRDARFYMILSATLAAPFLLTGLIFHQLELALAKGWTTEWLAGCFVTFGGAHFVVSLVMIPIIERIDERRLLPFCVLPLAGAMLTLALFDHPVSAIVYLGLGGATIGATIPVSTSLFADMYGVLHYGAIRSITTAAMVWATGAAPWAMGILLGWGISFETIAWGGFAYVMLGVAAAAIALRMNVADESDPASL